ncbi:MAG: hypothetical protein WDM76_17990 [Limisphaerales bacterium]
MKSIYFEGLWRARIIHGGGCFLDCGCIGCAAGICRGFRLAWRIGRNYFLIVGRGYAGRCLFWRGSVGCCRRAFIVRRTGGGLALTLFIVTVGPAEALLNFIWVTNNGAVALMDFT